MQQSKKGEPTTITLAELRKLGEIKSPNWKDQKCIRCGEERTLSEEDVMAMYVSFQYFWYCFKCKKCGEITQIEGVPQDVREMAENKYYEDLYDMTFGKGRIP